MPKLNARGLTLILEGVSGDGGHREDNLRALAATSLDNLLQQLNTPEGQNTEGNRSIRVERGILL